MPPRQPGSRKPSAATFRACYDDLEKRREELMARVAMLSKTGARHPALARARTLLNTTFRKASLVQRAAVLEAADWLIMMIDRQHLLRSVVSDRGRGDESFVVCLIFLPETKDRDINRI